MTMTDQLALDLSAGRCDTWTYPNGRPSRCQAPASVHTTLLSPATEFDAAVAHHLDQCDEHAAATAERFASTSVLVVLEQLAAR